MLNLFRPPTSKVATMLATLQICNRACGGAEINSA